MAILLLNLILAILIKVCQRIPKYSCIKRKMAKNKGKMLFKEENYFT
jgi:hypothetical protein